MFAVYVQGTAPFSRIHATATDVSSPPEKAIPTRSPTGSELSTLDMAKVYAHHCIFMQAGSRRWETGVSLIAIVATC